MNKRFTLRSLLLFGLICGYTSALFAQEKAQTPERPARKVYLSTGMDGYILSTSYLKKSFASEKLTTPRFTGFFHIGVNVNYDFSKKAGLFAGVSIKNIGFIEKFSNPDSTVKRRVYTIGIPVGLKLGNVTHGSYFLVGGGVDFPFNYKEKGFVKRSDKVKFNEWFSSRTPAVMPYVFIGAHLRPMFTAKLQYYPLNFLNTDFTEAGSMLKPYFGYDVKLIMLTFGIDISYRPKN